MLWTLHYTFFFFRWSLNAVDKIFSTMRTGEGAPGCPSGTEPAGYIMDSWKKWSLICLFQLSVEDSEDVWIFVVLVMGFLLFGLSGYLAHQKIKDMCAYLSEVFFLHSKATLSVEGNSEVPCFPSPQLYPHINPLDPLR
uniref:Uncharacterized protein n=1 Tax=Nothobranchius furzeri TaxID=105023 RepID=A0A8C6KM98_NOTFU